VLVGFLALAVGLYVGAARVADDQEHRLLAERTGEVGELLATALSTTLQADLLALATASQQPSGQAFSRLAQSQVGSSPTTTVALLAGSGSTWAVHQSFGPNLAAGQRLTGQPLALAQAADAQLRSRVLVLPGGKKLLVVALGSPATAPGTVVYEEAVVDPTRPTAITQSQPFHELNVALYAGSTPSKANLIIATTARTPLPGSTATYSLPVGHDHWLVVASARNSLSGSLASNIAGILFLATLLIGLAMGAVVEAIGRRHDYALTLVSQRTKALRESVHTLEQTQEALVASERLAALGEMAATVGHELRNPLGVLTNSLFLIRTAVAPDAGERLARQLDTADREVAAATLIVSDLLEFSRPRAANPTPVDVTELLDEAVSVAPPPTGITITHEGAPAAHVLADRDQLRQVVLNLLTNAYDAMPDGGQVTLSARTTREDIEIAVADTGVGMDDETRAQVFDPFFSLKVKGTGLGLAVSKRIVEAHAGSLTMTSQQGHGCTATIRLPHAFVGAGAAR
jgi:signal transduction histidine kinase